MILSLCARKNGSFLAYFSQGPLKFLAAVALLFTFLLVVSTPQVDHPPPRHETSVIKQAVTANATD